MRWFALLIMAALMSGCVSMDVEEQTVETNECVVILHGLGRTARAMAPMAKSLRQQGYTVWNNTYPSRKYSVQELAPLAIEPALAFCRQSKADKIHFVTHSLGGILVRQYLQSHNIEEMGRVVMISPPNHGSEVVDRLGHWPLFQRAVGPAGLQLGTLPKGIVHRLEPIAAEVGVITGHVSSDPWFSPMIAGKDDGKVSVASARLTEMRDFLSLPYGHTLISGKRKVIDQTQYFLVNGCFYNASTQEMRI